MIMNWLGKLFKNFAWKNKQITKFAVHHRRIDY